MAVARRCIGRVVGETVDIVGEETRNGKRRVREGEDMSVARERRRRRMWRGRNEGREGPRRSRRRKRGSVTRAGLEDGERRGHIREKKKEEEGKAKG